MSREDVGFLFPNKFVLGMKLYKIIQNCRREQHELSLTESEYENNNMSSISGSLASSTRILGKCSSTDKASSSSATSEMSASKKQKVRSDGDTKPEYLLPQFSEDVQKPFLEDSIFTTPQCNKLFGRSVEHFKDIAGSTKFL